MYGVRGRGNVGRREERKTMPFVLIGCPSACKINACMENNIYKRSVDRMISEIEGRKRLLPFISNYNQSQESVYIGVIVDYLQHPSKSQ